VDGSEEMYFDRAFRDSHFGCDVLNIHVFCESKKKNGLLFRRNGSNGFPDSLHSLLHDDIRFGRTAGRDKLAFNAGRVYRRSVPGLETLLPDEVFDYIGGDVS
jgi:hypothetical protein